MTNLDPLSIVNIENDLPKDLSDKYGDLLKD